MKISRWEVSASVRISHVYHFSLQSILTSFLSFFFGCPLCREELLALGQILRTLRLCAIETYSKADSSHRRAPPKPAIAFWWVLDSRSLGNSRRPGENFGLIT